MIEACELFLQRIDVLIMSEQKMRAIVLPLILQWQAPQRKNLGQMLHL
jgi:hypothetical protein